MRNLVSPAGLRAVIPRVDGLVTRCAFANGLFFNSLEGF
jgi:hypothetical protein